MNKKQFVLDSTSLKIKEILNKDFLEIEILAIAEGQNRNETAFTLEGMKKSIPTFYNKFILGYYKVHGDINNEGNFEEHNSDIKYDSECEEFYYSYLAPNAEKALGLIRESDKVEIVEVKGKKWIKLTAAILTKYNREAVKHLLKSKNKKKVSVEITIEKSHEENGITIIDEFTLDGITILGTRKNSNRLCEEGIEGASMILRFLQSEVYNTQKKALSFAYKELESEALNKNEEQETITMKDNKTNIEKEEGGKKPMLTYEQKRQLLEAKLNEILCSHNEETECCHCYCWVCDLDEEEVYYHFEENYWKASYIINEEESSVEINVGEAKQVTRSWKEFSLEEEQDIKTFVEQESMEKKEETSVEKEEFSEASVEEEVSEVSVEKEEFSETSVEEEDNSEISVEKEEFSEASEVNGEIFEEENKTEKDEEIDKVEEEVEDKDTECGAQCSEEEAKNKTEEDKEEVEEEFKEEIDNVNVYKEYTLEEIKLSLTEEDYSQLKTLYEATKTEIETLTNNYNEVKAKYDEILLTQKNEALFAYGKELLGEEEVLETENYEALVSTFEEKCKNNEFSSEEEVKSYTEEQIAKAVYLQVKNHKEKNNETTNFSTKIKAPVQNTEAEFQVEDSMARMKNLLKI